MKQTTLVMAYYENAGMLARQFEMIRDLPRELRDWLSVIIVDDGSPTAPAKPEDLNGVALQMYRLRVDVRWNQDACRNIGVRHSETTWVLMTDIDHMVPADTWRRVLLHKHDPDNVYRFSRVSAPEMLPYKPHPNTYLMTRDMFNKCGGYDERFAGFYGTDGDFKDRVMQNAVKLDQFKEAIIRVPRTVIPDASTTTYLRKQPEDKPTILSIQKKRNNKKGWVPLRGSFEYDRVHP